MRHARLIALLAALLLGACGSSQQAAGPAAPSSATTAAAETAGPLLNEGQVTEPSPTSPAAAATSAALPSEATAQLILPPATEVSTSAPLSTAATTAPAAQQPAPAPDASEPVRVMIKAIAVNQPIVSVGLDKNREPIVPRHNVGWYNLSAAPGQGENIVLWGHVLPFRSEPNIAPPFAHLKDLKIGASVVLYDKAGNAHNYVVTKQVWVTPNQVEYILPVGQERVTMVSCIGDKVITNGSVVDMTHRLITIAEPEE